MSQTCPPTGHVNDRLPKNAPINLLFQRKQDRPVIVEAQWPDQTTSDWHIAIGRRIKLAIKGMLRPARDLAETQGTLYQDDIQSKPYVPGTNADIFRGTLDLRDGACKKVAIKVVKRKSCQREAAVWTPLKHQNLVPLIAIIADRDMLISAFYENGNIRDYLRHNSRVKALKLVLGIASGLSYLHNSGVVHGDLKAENVLIDDDGCAQLTDFGISQVDGCRGCTTASIGTRTYIAPELLDDGLPKKGARTTRMSDVYSLGILALEIFSSIRPTETGPANNYQPDRENIVARCPTPSGKSSRRAGLSSRIADPKSTKSSDSSTPSAHNLGHPAQVQHAHPISAMVSPNMSNMSRRIFVKDGTARLSQES
ncbi:kinase-like domain-containing protein [Mycena olivaceomarginata]|nr:kinase-like domain-containing protein [Mycena olivaceomarginata]